MEVEMTVRRTNLLLALIALLALPLVGAAEAAQQPVLNVFLVQNSGWMEPFYVSGNSKFKPLVDAVVGKVAGKGEKVVVASFNQSDASNDSPRLAYRGSDSAGIRKAIDGIALAHKSSGALADTDFKEAIAGSITRFSPGKPCILWIFTNNKNSPNNSSETAEKNREFYNWIQGEDNIKSIVAYPYPMAVQGNLYTANGMMIYAMTYGQAADEQLKRMIASKLPFEDRPARLKPLNADAVTFVPTSVSKENDLTAALGADNNTLLLRFSSSNKPANAIIKGVFRNDFFPYDIQSADVSLNVKFLNDNHGINAEVTPRHLASVATGKQSEQVSVAIGIPPLPSIWRNPEIIFKSGYQTKAVMEFSLANQLLELSPEFLRKMNLLFPGDPLPDIFKPGDSAKQSVTTRPLVVDVEYPVWPLVLLIALAASLLFSALWLAASLTRARKYTLSVNGTQRTCALKAFGTCPLYGDHGSQIATLRRGLGRPTVELLAGCKDVVTVLN
jgi:hypothetical protein